MRAVAARRAQEVAGRVEAVGGHELVGALVLQRGPLELEEQQLRLDRRALLLDALHERADLRIGGVDAEAQHRVVTRARRQLGDGHELGHRRGELVGAELGQAPGVGVGKDLRALRGLVEEPVGAGVALAVDEW